MSRVQQIGPNVRYWIKGEDEDFEREWQRAMATGDALPADLSSGVKAAVGTMVAVQVVAVAGLVLLVVDWLRG